MVRFFSVNEIIFRQLARIEKYPIAKRLLVNAYIVKKSLCGDAVYVTRHYYKYGIR